jgi:hypothetical protein
MVDRDRMSSSGVPPRRCTPHRISSIKLPATFRAQATSFRAASMTFGQLSGLMDQQADLLERAGNLMRDPLTAFRSADDEAHLRGPVTGRRARSGGKR